MKEYMSQKKAGVFTKYLIDGASVLIERVSVKESFTSVVRVRTTTTCTPSAAIRTLR